jgi:hypothetical protein
MASRYCSLFSEQFTNFLVVSVEPSYFTAPKFSVGQSRLVTWVLRMNVSTPGDEQLNQIQRIGIIVFKGSVNASLPCLSLEFTSTPLSSKDVRIAFRLLDIGMAEELGHGIQWHITVHSLACD